MADTWIFEGQSVALKDQHDSIKHHRPARHVRLGVISHEEVPLFFYFKFPPAFPAFDLYDTQIFGRLWETSNTLLLQLFAKYNR